MRTCSKFQRAIESALVGDASPAALARAERHAKACGTCELIWPEVQATLELFKSVSVEASRVSRESLGTSRARLRAAFARAGCPPVAFSSVRSPVGLVYFGMSDRGLCDVTFGLRHDADYRRRLGRRVPEIWRDDAALREVRAEFLAYFDGRTRKFSIPADLRGVTPFVGAVLRLAKRLPFGRVTSYGSLARRLGRPRASRAVGSALGRNPVPIVIPCHRVVRATGMLGGYVGGARAKRALLRLEGAIA